jgi:hypothetical protein
MAAHPPPVPPEQRSDKGPDEPAASTRTKDQTADRPPDPKTGRFGAVKQNTTNKGYQQDR